MYNSLLTAFVRVADSGSFNKAAEALYVSPPAVMKQINALETHLDMKLLERTNHGVRLTPAGKVIYRHARYLFEYSARAVAEARREEEAGKTTFCIGSSLLNPCKPFMDLWYQVCRDFPGYRLHIVPFEDDHDGILSEISALGEKSTLSSASAIPRFGWTAAASCRWATFSTRWLSRGSILWHRSSG